MNDAAASAARATPRWLPWLLALVGWAFDVAAYWPGQMSFDSAYAWWQARGGETTDIAPPVFVQVWRFCDALVAGPGLLFALHLALFWVGLALLARALRTGVLATLAAMLLLALAPAPLVLRGHVWTDVGLFCALTCATGALACAQVECRKRWLLLALPMLVYASALRHNALPAIVPLAAWFAWIMSYDALASAPARAPRVAWTTLALLVAFVAANQAVSATVQRRVLIWPSLAQWDLAAVSIATGRMLLPDFMIGPGLDVADLAQAFRGWSNTPMLANTRHGMRDPFMPAFAPEQLSALRHAWLEAIVSEPGAWLAHRWRLTRALFGTHEPDWPHELIYVDDEVGYRDNPPVACNRGALHAALMRVVAALVATPALAAWPYLMLGLAAGFVAWRRRATDAGRIAGLLLASAWLYALPLIVLAPSAELRYLGWPCVASLLACICVAFAPRPAVRW
ncbi:hypothetical protein [Dokdonella soli]|uniref:Glycosyltransferase RgtA/B/C/D-like domain-containing protein n=1 Tax=Dokdonella soli TaxID=529810 RepID=A0ABN1IN64_9GAMM